MESQILNLKKTNTVRVRTWLGIAFCSLVLLVVFGFLGFRILQRRSDEMLRAKRAYTTTATVTAKQRVVISKDQPYYIGDLDERIPQVPGTEQWRVYYQIDNFDQVPEPKRTELIRSEVRRQKESGSRFREYYENAKEFYDRTEIGDKLAVHYKYIGDKKEILSIENLSHPRKVEATPR
jgi:hypothetical protein